MGRIIEKMALETCMRRFALFLLCSLSVHPAMAATESENDRVLFVLTRLGFGPTGNDISEVARMGVNTYIDRQLNPERFAPARLLATAACHLADTAGNSSATLPRFSPSQGGEESR